VASPDFKPSETIFRVEENNYCGRSENVPPTAEVLAKKY